MPLAPLCRGRRKLHGGADFCSTPSSRSLSKGENEEEAGGVREKTWRMDGEQKKNQKTKVKIMRRERLPEDEHGGLEFHNQVCRG